MGLPIYTRGHRARNVTLSMSEFLLLNHDNHGMHPGMSNHRLPLIVLINESLLFERKRQGRNIRVVGS